MFVTEWLESAFFSLEINIDGQMSLIPQYKSNQRDRCHVMNKEINGKIRKQKNRCNNTVVGIGTAKAYWSSASHPDVAVHGCVTALTAGRPAGHQTTYQSWQWPAPMRSGFVGLTTRKTVGALTGWGINLTWRDKQIY